MVSVAIGSNEGGVGKSTVSRELAVAFSYIFPEVFFIDVDPQNKAKDKVISDILSDKIEIINGGIPQVTPNLSTFQEDCDDCDAESRASLKLDKYGVNL